MYCAQTVVFREFRLRIPVGGAGRSSLYLIKGFQDWTWFSEISFASRDQLLVQLNEELEAIGKALVGFDNPTMDV
jgi:hypothetical protein